MARSSIVGIPRGRSLPFALGMKTRRNGCGLYPLDCFSVLIASRFRGGESHSSRSTPAVRLPWFSVTRRTAKALAVNERVNDRCRAFTLRQSATCVAFAIRICVVLTFRSTRCQSMACQSCGSCEDAEPLRAMIASMLSSRVAHGGRTFPEGNVSPRQGERRTKQPACDGCTTWK